jgi:ribosomal-protein-alanine N-acetyltransferase
MKQNFFTSFPTLTTKRLILRALSHRDEEEVFKLRSDDRVNKYLDREPCKSMKDARKFIQLITPAVGQNEVPYWAITLKGSVSLAGTICYFNINRDDSKAEIGFELMPAYHSKGIMQEALLTVIQFGFETLQLKTIEAFTHQYNKRSIRLLQKLNFKEQRTQHAKLDDEYILLKLSAEDAQNLLPAV